MTVLILAPEFDPTVDAVVLALTQRDVAVFRTDLSAFPMSLRLDAKLRDGRWRGRLWTAHREVRLQEIRAIWNRSPSGYRFPSHLSAVEQEFAYREARLGLGGVLASLDVLWVNHPNRCADAIFKPYQWKIAVECGLLVVETAITNDPTSALRFVDATATTITKALGPSGISEDGQRKLAYTRLLTIDDVVEIDCVSLTATTLQEFVPKAFEVRLTVIGDQWFPIAIYAASADAYTDWRSDPSALTYQIVPIPEAVVDGVSRYLKRTNLVFAGLDFVVTPQQEWVLLEVNSGPQTGWLEAATGAPMVQTMADLLMAGTP